jgi:hypothetical protein
MESVPLHFLADGFRRIPGESSEPVPLRAPVLGSRRLSGMGAGTRPPRDPDGFCGLKSAQDLDAIVRLLSPRRGEATLSFICPRHDVYIAELADLLHGAGGNEQPSPLSRRHRDARAQASQESLVHLVEADLYEKRPGAGLWQSVDHTPAHRRADLGE